MFRSVVGREIGQADGGHTNHEASRLLLLLLLLPLSLLSTTLQYSGCFLLLIKPHIIVPPKNEEKFGLFARTNGGLFVARSSCRLSFTPFFTTFLHADENTINRRDRGAKPGGRF